MGDSEPPDILCESCACIVHRAACPFLVKHSTIITSEESLRDSKLPVTDWVPEDQGTGVSVWNLCLCHSHYSTQLATCATSYMCISIVSHFTVMFARGTCASWSSSVIKVSGSKVKGPALGLMSFSCKWAELYLLHRVLLNTIGQCWAQVRVLFLGKGGKATE